MKKTQKTNEASKLNNDNLWIRPVGLGQGTTEYAPLDKKVLPEPSTLYTLLGRRKMSHNDRVRIRKNIETMEQARELGDPSLLKALNEDFKKIHGPFFRGCDFRNERQAAIFSALKLLLPREETNQFPARSRQPDDVIPDARQMMQVIDILQQNFITALSELPVSKARAGAVNQIQTSTPATAQPHSDLTRFGTRIPNVNGDLYSALAGRALSNFENFQIRARVAPVKYYAEEETPEANTTQLRQGISMQAASPFTATVKKLMAQRHGITNAVLAHFQSIPGTYAGKSELLQWTLVDGNRKRKVLVIDEDEGTAALFARGKSIKVHEADFEAAMKDADIVLCHARQQWEQVARPPEWQNPRPKRQLRFTETSNAVGFEKAAKPAAIVKSVKRGKEYKETLHPPGE